MRRFTVVLTVFLIGATHHAGAAQVDVTRMVRQDISGLVYDRTANTFDAELRLTNTSSSTLVPQVWVVVQGLPQTVSIANAAGFTVAGLPYVSVKVPKGAIDPGQSVEDILLKFNNPNGIQIRPELSVLAELVGQGLPPDPGEGGKKTIGGIDSDHDGVRDDIQRYIAFTYPNSAKLRAALTNDAIGMEAAVLTQSEDGAFLAAGEINSAQDCLWALFSTAASRYHKLLKSEFMNTWPRVDAFSAYDKKLAGASFALPSDSQAASRCGFDPKSLPN